MTPTQYQPQSRRRDQAGHPPARRPVALFGAFVALALAATLSGGCGGGNSENIKQPVNTSSRVNPLSSLVRANVQVTRGATAVMTYGCWVASTPSQRGEAFSWVSYSETSPKQGMILVYPGNGLQGFTGRNTLMNLDLAFAEIAGDGIGRIVGITTVDAFQRVTTLSGTPSKYVLFVGRGRLASDGVKVGDLISVPVPTPTR